MSSIRYKILSLCLVLAIVPTVAVSAYGVYSTINALQLNSLKEQDTKISLLGKQLDRALSAVKSDILYFRYSTSMQDLIIKSADPKLTFEQRMAARGRLAKDFLAFAELLNQSHASLRDDYTVSCPELDCAVDAALAHGALGARMVGGGFGGSAIALIKDEDAGRISQAIEKSFAEHGFKAPRFFDSLPSDGAKVIS